MGRRDAMCVRKQFRRKEDRRILAEALTAVKNANSLKDPMELLPAFRNYSHNGLTVTFETKPVKKIELSTLEWILDLEKRNMEKLYNDSDWGWEEEKKYREMTEDLAWYLIAYKEDKTPVAFSHFRFDMDYGDKVLYCYELQLEPDVRRKKLGKFMMQILELLAFKNDMTKVILTVLKHNLPALQFFRSLNYNLDPTSPEDYLEETFCYYILSKFNKRLEAKR